MGASLVSLIATSSGSAAAYVREGYPNVRMGLFLKVATRNWLPGKKVLVSPAWIERVSWADSKVYAGLAREAIVNAPEYFLSRPLTREYESRLYFHYGRPPYWVHEAELKSSLSLSTV